MKDNKNEYSKEAHLFEIEKVIYFLSKIVMLGDDENPKLSSRIRTIKRNFDEYKTILQDSDIVAIHGQINIVDKYIRTSQNFKNHHNQYDLGDDKKYNPQNIQRISRSLETLLAIFNKIKDREIQIKSKELNEEKAGKEKEIYKRLRLKNIKSLNSFLKKISGKFEKFGLTGWGLIVLGFIFILGANYIGNIFDVIQINSLEECFYARWYISLWLFGIFLIFKGNKNLNIYHHLYDFDLRSTKIEIIKENIGDNNSSEEAQKIDRALAESLINNPIFAEKGSKLKHKEILKFLKECKSIISSKEESN